MFKFLKKLWKDRRGNALVIAGAALPLVVGSAGLAADTIQWSLWKRQLQRVADSAALAGAYAKGEGQSLDSCAAYSSATFAQPIGYDVKKNNTLWPTLTCAATNPPSTGGYTADTKAVRVTVSVQQALPFAGYFMSGLALASRRSFAAGLVLGCLIVKPQLALLLPVAFIAARSWRVIAGAAISSTGILLAGALLLGPATTEAWLHQLPLYATITRDGLVGWSKLSSIYAATRA